MQPGSPEVFSHDTQRPRYDASALASCLHPALDPYTSIKHAIRARIPMPGPAGWLKVALPVDIIDYNFDTLP